MKSRFFGGLRGIQILKVPYMSYLGKVFENLTNKVQFFQKFKNFQFFRVFVLRKISNWFNLKLFYCRLCFETVDYVICLKEIL